MNKAKEKETRISHQGFENYPDFPKVVVKVPDDQTEMEAAQSKESEGDW